MKKMILFSCLFVITFSAVAAEDIVIGDYEGRAFGDWKVEGTAFGERPVRGRLREEDQESVSGKQGRSFANSFHGGDKSTGTLTSPTFEIKLDRINFLIGGGAFKGETCINLIVDGEVVRTETGPMTEYGGHEALGWKSWDVKELKGEMAHIQIVDSRTAQMGHIMVDHVVQSDYAVVMVQNVERGFTFEKKYLNFPVSDGVPRRLIHVLIDDEIVRELSISLASGEPDYWVYLELNEFKGKEATIRIDTLNSSKKKGFFQYTRMTHSPVKMKSIKRSIVPNFISHRNVAGIMTQTV